MNPINQAGRTKAFYKFLLFFVITIGVMITAIFFSYKVPLKDNDRLMYEKKQRDKEDDVVKNFQAIMKKTGDMIDTLPYSKTESIALMNKNIDDNVNALYKLTDSLSSGEFYLNVISNLIRLHDAKKAILQANNCDEQITRLTAERDKQKDNYDDLKDEIDRHMLREHNRKN